MKQVLVLIEQLLCHFDNLCSNVNEICLIEMLHNIFRYLMGTGEVRYACSLDDSSLC